MYYRVLLLLTILLFSCRDNIVRRSTADYYPDAVGAAWLYNSGSLEIFMQVEAETTWANYEAALFTVNGESYFRAKQADGIYYYFDLRVPYGGYEYPIETRYRKWIQLPLLAGSDWGDVMVDSIEVSGQRVRIEHRIAGRVVGFEDIDVPAGVFQDVYHVEIVNVCRISSSIYTRLDSAFIHEYYAPDIGLAIVDSSGKRFQLTQHQGL